MIKTGSVRSLKPSKIPASYSNVPLTILFVQVFKQLCSPNPNEALISGLVNRVR